MKEYLYFGKIVNTHGIKGEIKILSNFSRKEDVLVPNFNLYIGKDYQKHTIISYRHHQNFEMVILEEINDISVALKLKSLPVYVKRADLKKGKNNYLNEELISFKIIEDNQELGIISQIIYNNGNDLFLVNSQKNFYIPIKGDFIQKVDLNKRLVYTKNARSLIL